jgi:hypothetical protein
MTSPLFWRIYPSQKFSVIKTCIQKSWWFCDAIVVCGTTVNVDIYYVHVLQPWFSHTRKATECKYILFYHVFNTCLWPAYSNIVYDATVTHFLVHKLWSYKTTSRPSKGQNYSTQINLQKKGLLLINNNSIYHLNSTSTDGTQNY